MKKLFEEYGGNIDIDVKNNMLKILKSEPYSRICFSLRHHYQCYLEIPLSVIKEYI
mgnify:CR=1 FL=1